MPKGIATVCWYKGAMMAPPANYSPDYVNSQIIEGYKAFLVGETNGTMSDMACEFYLLFKAGRANCLSV